MVQEVTNFAKPKLGNRARGLRCRRPLSVSTFLRYESSTRGQETRDENMLRIRLSLPIGFEARVEEPGLYEKNCYQGFFFMIRLHLLNKFMHK